MRLAFHFLNCMKTIHCLLLEDDLDDRQLFLDALMDMQEISDCHCVSNGKEALSAIQAGLIPDVIFTDYHMPQMDGLEFVTALRTNNLFSKIPVYVFTSQVSDKLIRLFTQSGAQRVFAKTTLTRLKYNISQCVAKSDQPMIL